MERLNFGKNQVKIAAFGILLLVMLYPASLCMASGGVGQGSTSGNIGVPGVPDSVVKRNKTDITPIAEMEQVRAGELILFCYRNITMLMNCTRNCTIIFTADPSLKPKFFGLSIDPNQTMTLTMNISGSPLEGALVMERTLNFYLA